jgi:hypothetical protein
MASTESIGHEQGAGTLPSESSRATRAERAAKCSKRLHSYYKPCATAGPVAGVIYVPVAKRGAECLELDVKRATGVAAGVGERKILGGAREGPMHFYIGEPAGPLRQRRMSAPLQEGQGLPPRAEQYTVRGAERIRQAKEHGSKGKAVRRQNEQNPGGADRNRRHSRGDGANGIKAAAGLGQKDDAFAWRRWRDQG